MINPGEIPQIPGDIEAVARHGGTLRTEGKSFGSTGSDVHSTWQGLSAFYSAPEAAELFAATGPVKQKTEAVGSDIAAVGAALVTYADEVRPIKARLASLQSEAQTFVSSVSGDDDWRKDGAKVNHNNQLLSDVNGQISAWMAAQRRCANAIDRLFGGTQYVEDNGDGTRNQNEFGYSSGLLNQATAGDDGVPWGKPAERDKPWYEDVGDAIVSFGKGVVVDGLWGTVKGLGNLAGFGGWDGLKQSWGGLLKLGLALSPALLVINQFTGLPGLPKGTLPNTLRDTGKALLAWDQWKHDPARAAGNVVFNVASVVFGTKGAGATTKGLSAAAKGARATELVTRVSIKVSEVVATIKTKIPTLKLPNFLTPKTIAYALDEDYLKTQQLINDAKTAGLKIDEDMVVQIGRDPNGKIVWLEEGGINPRTGNEAGLRHIVNQHGPEFEKAGIPRDEVGQFVHQAVTEGKYTGYYQGSQAPGRPIFELEYNGKTYYVAVQVGKNGYIVGADLRSASDPFRRATIDPHGTGDPTYRGW
jgi:hypothetical protein